MALPQAVAKIAADQATEQLKSLGKSLASGDTGAEIAQALEWPKQPINRLKIQLLMTWVGILLLVPLMNLQWFFSNAVGITVPKLLPKMPWWEVMILCALNLLIALALLITITVVLAPIILACNIPGVSWISPMCPNT